MSALCPSFHALFLNVTRGPRASFSKACPLGLIILRSFLQTNGREETAGLPSGPFNGQYYFLQDRFLSHEAACITLLGLNTR